MFLQHTNTQSQGQSTWGRVFWACQWLSLLTQFVCLPLSPSLSQSQSVALSQFVFSKKGVGALHYKNFTYALWIFFFYFSVSFYFDYACCVVVVNQLPNCILYIIFTLKNHRNVAHTQHSHKVAEILNTTHSFMQLLYCIKSPKTRQKNTHNNNKGRRRQTAQQQRWRSVALFLFSLNERQCVQKYEQHWHSLFTHTHRRILFLRLSCKAFVYRLTCVIGICDVPLWCACVSVIVCVCVITIAFAPCARRGR